MSDMALHILTLTFLSITIAFQIINFIKFGGTDDADIKRFLFFATTVCFVIHTIRLMNGHSQGYFFSMGVVTMLSLYIKSKDD